MGERDTTPPVITNFSIYSQTDDKIAFDVQASDDQALSEVWCVLYSCLGTNLSNTASSNIKASPSGSDRVSIEKVGAGHWRYAFDLTVLASRGGIAGDHHVVQAYAVDTSGNASCDRGESIMFDESRATIYFDFQASPHVTLKLGETITDEELFEGCKLRNHALFTPKNMVLMFDGYDASKTVQHASDGTVFTATSVGTEPYFLEDYSFATKRGVVVTVVDPTPAKVDLSGASIAAVANQTYTGSALKPVPAVTVGGKELTAGTDYSVAYSNNVNAGTDTATVTGKGSYTGSKATTSTIVPAAVRPTVTLAATSLVYNGTAQKPAAAARKSRKHFRASKSVGRWRARRT